MCEATSQLIHEHEAVPRLFGQLRDALADFSAATPPARIELVELWFLLQLLDAAGHAPHLEQCVRCGRAPGEFARAHLSRDEGGIVCEHCLPGTPEHGLPEAGVRVFGAIARCDALAGLEAVRITAQGGAQLLSLTREFVMSRIGRPLKSLEGFGASGAL